jgi:hypothetical protein
MLRDIGKTYMNMLGMCQDVKCPNIAARKKRSLMKHLVSNLLSRFKYVSVNERILLVLQCRAKHVINTC